MDLQVKSSTKVDRSKSSLKPSRQKPFLVTQEPGVNMHISFQPRKISFFRFDWALICSRTSLLSVDLCNNSPTPKKAIEPHVCGFPSLSRWIWRESSCNLDGWMVSKRAREASKDEKKRRKRKRPSRFGNFRRDCSWKEGDEEGAPVVRLPPIKSGGWVRKERNLNSRSRLVFSLRWNLWQAICQGQHHLWTSLTKHRFRREQMLISLEHFRAQDLSQSCPICSHRFGNFPVLALPIAFCILDIMLKREGCNKNRVILGEYFPTRVGVLSCYACQTEVLVKLQLV